MERVVNELIKELLSYTIIKLFFILGIIAIVIYIISIIMKLIKNI